MSRRHISTDPSRPFSDAVLIDSKTLYISGRIGFEPGTTRIPLSIEEEVARVMEDLQEVLASAGMRLEDLVSLQVFCSDVTLWERFNAVYRTFFTGPLPARFFLGSGPLLFGAHFELQGIAIRDGVET